MRRKLAILAMVALAAGCGSATVDTGDTTATSTPTSTTTVEPSTTTSSEPDDANVEQLTELRTARARWEEVRPATYAFEYSLGCECDGGPFRVEVDAAGSSTVTHMYGGTTEYAYPSIDAIFDQIEQAIIDDQVPVRVEYDAELGYPSFYVWNEPELPVDGGFTMTISDFVADPANQAEAELEAARTTWRDLALADYDYTFLRNCFCAEEWRGPYEVQVRGGEVVSATFRGTDLLDLDVVAIVRYGELILTVDEIFAEIERSIGEVAELRVEYDEELGYPVDVFIDVDRRMADEEIGYVIENLRPASTLEECSTSSAAIDLSAQPDLPDPVAATRQAIYEAAMACDIAGLADLTSAEGFNASFGGGDPVTLWSDAERRGDPVLLDLVQHLNQAFTEFGEGGDIAGYVWPSAFLELEAPDGAGLPADEYADLLTLYTRDEIDDMFDFIGGYVGYRIGILPDGEWTYFVAGD